MSTGPDQHDLDRRTVTAALELALRVGRAVLGAGVASGDTAVTMATVAAAAGVPRDRIAADVTLNTLLVTITGDPGALPVSRALVVDERRVDHTRLTALYRLVDDLVAGRIGAGEALAEVERIDASPPPYPLRLAELGTAGLAGGVVALIGGNVYGIAVAVVTTFLTLRVTEFAERRGLPRFFGNVAGGALVTAVAVAVASAGVPVRPSYVVAGGIVALLPALELLSAVSDVLSGHHVTAAGRFLDVLFLAGGIAVGVVFVLGIATRFGVEPTRFAVIDDDVPPLLRLVAAGLASALFVPGVLGPWRLMPYAGVVGAAGAAVVLALSTVDVTGATAVGLTAALIGTAAVVVGRRLRVPAVVMAVPGFIPLLPGLALYEGMYEISTGRTGTGLLVLSGAVGTAVALTSGIVLGDVVSARLRRWRRLVVRQTRWGRA